MSNLCICSILILNKIFKFYVNNKIKPTADALRDIPIQA